MNFELREQNRLLVHSVNGIPVAFQTQSYYFESDLYPCFSLLTFYLPFNVVCFCFVSLTGLEFAEVHSASGNKGMRQDACFS